MKQFSFMLSKRLLVVMFILVLLLIIATGNHGKTNFVANINNIKSLEAVHIVQKYDNLEEEKLEVKMVSNMLEAREYGSLGPISFVGQMTSYGPDCVGCNGYVSCPPRQNVKNNIYYDDHEYGKIRIFAADKAIPCGSIVKIINPNFYSEDIIGIVLDRGSAIKGNIMDLLVTGERANDAIGRQFNVNYQIIRWGW